MGIGNFLKKIRLHMLGIANVQMKANVKIEAYHKGEDKPFAVRECRNVITNTGKAKASGLYNGDTSGAFTYIAVGTGTTSELASDTALQSEITDSGLERAVATVSRTTTTTTNDTAVWQKTFNVTGSKAVTESGIFDASLSGNMLCRKTFSAISVQNGDTLQITWKVQLT